MGHRARREHKDKFPFVDEIFKLRRGTPRVPDIGREASRPYKYVWRFLVAALPRCDLCDKKTFSRSSKLVF
jgi:hypothetical protein